MGFFDKLRKKIEKKIILVPGCFINQKYPELLDNYKVILRKFVTDFDIHTTCCGKFLYDTGYKSDFFKIKSANLKTFDRKEVITVCSYCNETYSKDVKTKSFFEFLYDKVLDLEEDSLNKTMLASSKVTLVSNDEFAYALLKKIGFSVKRINLLNASLLSFRSVNKELSRKMGTTFLKNAEGVIVCCGGEDYDFLKTLFLNKKIYEISELVKIYLEGVVIEKR